VGIGGRKGGQAPVKESTMCGDPGREKDLGKFLSVDLGAILSINDGKMGVEGEKQLSKVQLRNPARG